MVVAESSPLDSRLPVDPLTGRPEYDEEGASSVNIST
jgi:hypothetical protein